MLQFNKEIKQFWTYRSAYVNASLIIHLTKEQREDLREYLGNKSDNHICWQDEDNIYYMYTDGKLLVGNSIKIMNW